MDKRFVFLDETPRMMYKLTLAILSIILLTSCVSQRKYEDLQAEKNQLQEEVDRLQQIEEQYEDLKKEYERTKEELAGKNDEIERLQKKYDNLDKSQSRLLDKYNQLLDQNNKMLSNSSEEKKALAKELAQRDRELREREQELRTMERELEKREDRMDQLEKELAEREESIDNLNEKLNEQRDNLLALKDKLNEALLGFSDTDLSVEQKGGRVYVSMSQNLLFAKGSDRIDSEGKDALRKLAGVLQKHPDLSITVEGHTDTDGSAALNWELSVQRATAVINVLQDSGVNPERITASGRAFYAPIAPNDTEQNKSKNRRTEIILSPDLEDLYNLVK